MSAMALSDLLTRHGVSPAPTSLLTSLMSSGSTGSAHLMPIANRILLSMSLAAAKIAAIAAVLLLAIPAVLLFLHGSDATPVFAQLSPLATVVPPAPASSEPPTTSPASADSIIRIPNETFKNRCRANEYSIGIDPDTRRTTDSAPAGYIKSLLPAFNPNDQGDTLRYVSGPYPDLHGKRVRLSAWLKTSKVEGWCGLRMLVFGKNNTQLADDDMRDRPIHGTMDWTQEQIVLDVPSNAVSIAILSFIYGKGEVWSDDFQLQTVGPEVPVTGDEPWKKFSFFAANYTATPDPQVQHDGHPTICLSSTSEARTPQWISYNHEEANIDPFRGKRVRVTIWIKSSRVTGHSGPSINVFGLTGKIASDGQVGHRPVRGTTDWKEYTAVADVPAGAKYMGWGVVMNGTGKIWIDLDSAEIDVDDPGTDGL